MVLRKETQASVTTASHNDGSEIEYDVSAVDDKFKRLNLFFEKEKVGANSLLRLY